MKRETRTVLETPFTSEQIKQRKGSFGKMLDYIEGHSIIHRLNEAFESDWSFEITEHNVYEEEVVAIGKLTVANITKMQFGSNKVTRDSNTGKILSLGDDLKSASTDALKKCASLLGIGLHLYGDVGGGTIELPQKKVGRPKNSTTVPATKKVDDPNTESATPVVSAPTPKVETPKVETPSKNNGGNGSGNNGGNGNGDNGYTDKITSKQLNYVLVLGKRNNLTAKAIEGLSKEMFDVTLPYITKNQASALIHRLAE